MVWAGLLVIVGASLLRGGKSLLAAEIQLHSMCRADGGLVLLEDVADVLSADADEVKRLGQVDVMAAPPAGERRFVRAREIQDILASRGVNMAAHRFSGASQVTVFGTLQTPKPAAPKPVATPAVSQTPKVTPKQTTDQFRKALVEFLNECAARENADWQIQFNLDADQIALVNAAGKDLIISGGHEPWTGTQKFQLAANIDGETRRSVLRTEITLPATLVVATRALTIGATVREGDVRVENAVPLRGRARAYQSVEEVIGKEVVRNVAENQILDEDSVRRPIYVRRGEIVTVYARAGGIQVRTTARARDDGSHNDLVAIESLNDRKPFAARVIGPQEVEVFAHAVGVTGEEAESRSTAKAAQLAVAPPAPLPTNKPTPQAPLPAEMTASASRVVARDTVARDIKAKAVATPSAQQTKTTGRVMAVVVPPRREEGGDKDSGSGKK
jgi:flagella basal body P-ring formation protein FlgA